MARASSISIYSGCIGEPKPLKKKGNTTHIMSPWKNWQNILICFDLQIYININKYIPWKSKTKQRMVLRMIHVKDSLLPRGKVWSLDFLGIYIYYTIYLGYNLGAPRVDDFRLNCQLEHNSCQKKKHTSCKISAIDNPKLS